MANNPPWIRKTQPLFKPVSTTQGNDSDNHALYNNTKWRTASASYFKGRRCEHPNCIRLAQCTDHIISMRSGGSQYDRRNWMRLCHPHHNRKRGQEAHGKIEPSVDTPTGKIPASRQHEPPDVYGESYLNQEQ